ncbi:MAG: exosortase-dependent surface protein XDP2 [Bauldia sp.]
MKKHLLLGAASVTVLSATAFAQTGVGYPADVTVTPFVFQAIASRNPDFDRSAYLYPEGNARAGEVNRNVGDVRLDGVSINGITYTQDQLQLVTAATVIIDDAVDLVRGGANFAAGYGIGADLDTWVGEGVGTTSPTTDDIVANHGNFNLTSIVATREGSGTAIFELTFAEPTDTLLVFERGGSGDVLVSALDAEGRVLGSYKVRDGSNDAGAPSDYARTGITVTTYVQEGFLNQGQELGAVGLRFSQPVTTFRFTSYQEPEGEGAVRFNGPDLKVLALAP